MNKKHTSGPWLIKGDEVGCISNHDDQSFGMFCPVAIVTNQDSAGLIAAAPDLLVALEQLVSDYERGIHVEFGGSPWLKEKLEELNYARAAIAKALGENNE